MEFLLTEVAAVVELFAAILCHKWSRRNGIVVLVVVVVVVVVVSNPLHLSFGVVVGILVQEVM